MWWLYIRNTVKIPSKKRILLLWAMTILMAFAAFAAMMAKSSSSVSQIRAISQSGMVFLVGWNWWIQSWAKFPAEKLAKSATKQP